MNERYQPGGDIYAEVESKWGTSAANQVAAAALVSDGGYTLRNLLADLNAGHSTAAPGSDSTLGNFFTQITTDPLAAPLASVNTALGNTFFSFLKSPWVIFALGVVIFAWAGGFQWLGRQLKGKLA